MFDILDFEGLAVSMALTCMWTKILWTLVYKGNNKVGACSLGSHSYTTLHKLG